MSRDSRVERLVRAAGQTLAEHELAPAAIAELGRRASELDGETDWIGCVDLPVEREVELLARALLDRFERGGHGAELRVELRLVEWRGRVDGCELAVGGDPQGPRQASPLLRAVVCADGGQPDAFRLELALACAAALVRGALDRIEAELVLGEAAALQVEVGFVEGERRGLGLFDGAWQSIRAGWARQE